MTSIYFGRFTKKVACVTAGLVAQDPDREVDIVRLSMGFRLSVSQATKELCVYSKRGQIQVKIMFWYVQLWIYCTCTLVVLIFGIISPNCFLS